MRRGAKLVRRRCKGVLRGCKRGGVPLAVPEMVTGAKKVRSRCKGGVKGVYLNGTWCVWAAKKV